MSLSKRFVIDTNVLVSAMILPDSTADQAVRAALTHGDVLMSEAVFREVSDVLARPKWLKYLSIDERAAFINGLIDAVVSVPVATTIAECRDPDDDKYLELAVDGRAGCIVTGDQDLLALHPFRGILILTPQQFLTEYAGADAD